MGVAGCRSVERLGRCRTELAMAMALRGDRKAGECPSQCWGTRDSPGQSRASSGPLRRSESMVLIGVPALSQRSSTAPPRQEAPPRQKCNGTYPVRRASLASISRRIDSGSRSVLSSVSTLSTNRPIVLPSNSRARTCVPSVSPSRRAICSSF